MADPEGGSSWKPAALLALMSGKPALRRVFDANDLNATVKTVPDAVQVRRAAAAAVAAAARPASNAALLGPMDRQRDVWLRVGVVT